MDKEKRKIIFSHRPPWRSFIFVIGVLTAIIHLFDFRVASDGEFPIPMMILMVAVDAALIWGGYILMTQTQVTIYNDGIELMRGGARLFASWDKLSHLGIKDTGLGQRRGIFLHEKVQPEVKGLIEKLLFGRETDFMSLGRYVYLPRDMRRFKYGIDTEKLLETEFGQTLYESAPQLFEE